MTVLRTIAFALTTLLALLITALLVCAALAVPINLTPLHGVIERGMAKALAREVTLAGLELRVALQPEVTLSELRIGQPHGWQGEGDFARIAAAQVQFDLLSLLKGELALQRVRGENLELMLADGPDGTSNWHFQSLNHTAEKTTPRLLSQLKALTLRQVTVRYRTADDATPTLALQLETLNASAVAGTSLKLELVGQCWQQPCQLNGQWDRSGDRFRLSQIQGRLAESILNGQAELDLSEGRLALSTQLNLSTLDAGQLRAWWPDTALSGPIKQITLKANSQGADFAALLASLAITLQANSTQLRLARADQKPLAINLSRTELTLAPGQPLRVSTDGRLHQRPLSLNITSDVSQLLPPAGTGSLTLPLQLVGKIGADTVSADGLIGKQDAQLTLDLRIDANGPRFDHLAALFVDIDAPALPYRLRTHLRHTGTEARLSDLVAEIGHHTWQGELSVSEFGGPAQRLTAKLHTPVLNLAGARATASKSVISRDKALPKQAHQAEVALGLDQAQRRQIQTALTRLGFDTGGADGIFGRHTRRAIRDFQTSRQQAPSGYLNAAQLALLLNQQPPSSPSSPPSPPSPAASQLALLDRPLPTNLALLDSELELFIERLILSRDTEINALSFSARLDQDRAQSSFQGTLAGHRLDGTLMLDLRDTPAKVQLSIAARQFDVGVLLRDLRIADDIDLSAGQFNATLAAQGATLRALLSGSTLDATLADGRWVIGPPSGKSHTLLKLASSTLQAQPGQPVTITSDARLRNQALTLTLHGEPLGLMLANQSGRLQFAAKSADAELTLSGTVSLPLDRSRLAAQLKLSGTRLDRLGPLLEIALPPLGPYTLAGTLRTEQTGYRLQDLVMRIGASELRGQLQLATEHKTPSLALDLRAKQLQLADFGLNPRRPSPPAGAAAQRQTATKTTPEPADARIDSLIDLGQRAVDDWLNTEAMRHLDARLTLDAGRVVLDQNTSTGAVSLAASLSNGRFTLQRWLAKLGGGALGLQLDLQPEANGLATELKVDIERFDYGMLLRLFEPEAKKLQGHFTLDAALRGRAPNFDTFPAHASGHLRFVLQPRALEAGSLTLWELNLLNLLTLLLPKLDDDSGSKINCIIGQFPIENGVVKISPGALIIDTSKVRASGEGEVNFKQQRIDLTLIPKVKSPHAFDLATSVRISGHFDDFGAAIAPGGLIQTITGLPLGLNRFWQRFFDWKSIPPADGSDLCNGSPLPAPTGSPAQDPSR